MPDTRKLLIKMKEQEGEGIAVQDRSSGSTMELRRVRKMTDKKRILEDESKDELPVTKRNKTEKEDVESEIEDFEEDNSTMTLEQFTEIVLASEGLSVEKRIKKEIDEENNNKANTKELVTNLMENNNDLIVEMKAKPVVLSPRQPPGNRIINHHFKATANPLSSSVIVSVKPRIQSNPSSTISNSSLSQKITKPLSSKPSTLTPGPPQNKPPNVPHLVEEWFRKMPQEKTPLNLSKKDDNTSVKSQPTTKSIPPSSNSPVGKTSQVYLRPIPTSPKPTAPCKSSLSPPRLEITRVTNSISDKTCSNRLDSGSIHAEAVRARALRDVQVAHTKDMHGNFPIHMAVLMRKPDLVRRYCCILQILESHIDLLNEDNMTPLHLSIRDGSLEIMSILLSFGANPMCKDQRGNSAIHLATTAKDTDLLRTIIKYVAAKEINVLNDYGLTPLHIATMNNDLSSAELLTKNGADPTIPDSIQGLSPLAMAKQGKLNLVDQIPKKTHVEIPSR